MLRLLSRGHDGKSAAQVLGISLSAVHERLREARRKLGVASSRDAARLLAAAEGYPENPVDEPFGLGRGPDPLPPGLSAQRGLAVMALGGLMMIGIVVGAIALAAVGNLGKGTGEGGSAPPPAETAPHVVRTVPAQGATIAPGPFALSVTFDRPMQAGSYSFVQVSADSFPDCELTPRGSADARTYTMRCTAAPGRRYEIWLNRPPYLNFKSATGASAEPYQLLFRARDR